MKTTNIKTTILFGFLLFAALFTFNSCDDDDDLSDVSIPEFSNFPTSISSAPGYEFVFEGMISDDNGISSVNMSYSNWYLDKTITFDNPPKEYNLKYKFLVPADETPDSSHTIQVSVTDVADNTTTYDVVVTLDFDVTKPVITFNTPTAGESFAKGESVELNIDFSDDKELAMVKVVNEELGLAFEMELDPGSTAYNYTNTIEIPLEGVEGAISFDATATDATGNQETSVATILVGDADVIPAVYMVGGSAWWEWDPSKATQMWLDPEDDQWFVLEFYYWSGYGVKFIGQLGWEPNNWGTDPNDPSKIINSQDSGTIDFAEGDGYYRLRFNPYTLQYTYEPMTVDVEVKENMYLMGNGFVGSDLDWNPADAIPMEKDGWGNPYVFTAWVEFSDDVSLKFIGQTDGWGPYDCGFEVGGEHILPLNYVQNKVGDGSGDVKFKDQAGWYWITFDYFLNRTTIQPYNE